MKENLFVHPYIPNSVPEMRAAMLREIGVKSVDELYSAIPDALRLKGRLNLPEPILSEAGIKRHVEKILHKNTTCAEYLNFLGAGCWQHHVPAVVDEIVGRSEFLTAYDGGNYCDHGKWQAKFEYCSLMGDLLNMDIVSETNYTWGTASGLSFRMANRITKRKEVLVPRTISPERLSEIRNICQPEEMPTAVKIVTVDVDMHTGRLNLEDLQKKISDRTAAVYIENPTYLGFIEDQGETIAKIAHVQDAIFIGGVDPISLGVLKPPADYGADMVTGELQSLGIHMNGGGGQAGFIAFHEDETYLSELPCLVSTIMETAEEGRFAFAEMLFDRTSYGLREQGKDFTGTASGLWCIGAAVYLALMGPQGMREVGETILQNTQYAKNLLGEIDGIKISTDAASFKEFVVNFDDTGQSVADINRALLSRRIFGGKDLTLDFPELGNCALFCVTEIHTMEEIHELAHVLQEVIQ